MCSLESFIIFFGLSFCLELLVFTVGKSFVQFIRTPQSQKPLCNVAIAKLLNQCMFKLSNLNQCLILVNFL